MVLPAWMTQGQQGGAAAPGSQPHGMERPPSQLPASSNLELVRGRDPEVDPSAFLLDLVGAEGGGGGGGPRKITSIEEALAILEAHGGGKKDKKDKKDKKKKDKGRKGKKEKQGSSKKGSRKSGGSKRDSRDRRREGSGSDSGSSSDSDSDRGGRR